MCQHTSEASLRLNPPKHRKRAKLFFCYSAQFSELLKPLLIVKTASRLAEPCIAAHREEILLLGYTPSLLLRHLIELSEVLHTLLLLLLHGHHVGHTTHLHSTLREVHRSTSLRHSTILIILRHWLQGIEFYSRVSVKVYLFVKGKNHMEFQHYGS